MGIAGCTRGMSWLAPTLHSLSGRGFPISLQPMQSVAPSVVANRFLCLKLRRCSVPVLAAHRCVAPTGRRVLMGVPCQSSGLAASSNSTPASTLAQPSRDKTPCSAAGRSSSGIRSLPFFHVHLDIASRAMGLQSRNILNLGGWKFLATKPPLGPRVPQPRKPTFCNFVYHGAYSQPTGFKPHDLQTAGVVCDSSRCCMVVSSKPEK